MVHVRAEFAFSGTHGRVPAMVGILMAHVGREFAGSRAFLPHVCRREACPVHFCPQFTGPPRTGGRRVPRGRPPVLVRPEFRATVQTRRRRVPARSTARTREGRVCGPAANSRQKCTGGVRQGSRRRQPPPHGMRMRSSPGSKARVNTRVRWSWQSRGKVPGSASWPGHRCTRPA